MRYIVRCLTCGYGEEMEKVIANRCPNCDDLLVINDVEYDNQIAKEIEMDNDNHLLRNMKAEIKRSGSLKVWQFIEGIALAKSRTKYRAIFINAGGKIPITKIKGLTE